MLNYLLWYGLIWTVILILYKLEWSDLCIPIDSSIFTFIIVTIVVSFVLGFIFRKHFKFKRIDKYPKRTCVLTIALVLFALFEYAYCKQIPLFAIITKSKEYASYTGIPTLHVINSTLSTFYSQYLFYLFICFKKKKTLLVEYSFIILVVHLFEFNRGGLLICIMISALMLFASFGKKHFIRNLLIGLVVLVAGLYFFGVLGNLRDGGSWNSNFLSEFGQFNKNYPSWLPNQFMWPYLYLVCSLWNFTFIVGKEIYDFVSLISTFLPDFIVKRVFSESVLSGSIELLNPNFTTYTGYGTTYLYGGIVAIYFKYFFLIGINALALKLVRKPQYLIPSYGIVTVIVTMFFFTNTISYSAISFPLIYPILLNFKDNLTRNRMRSASFKRAIK